MEYTWFATRPMSMARARKKFVTQQRRLEKSTRNSIPLSEYPRNIYTK